MKFTGKYFKIIFEFDSQKRFFKEHPARKKILLAGLVLLLGWQGLAALTYKKLSPDYKRSHASGLMHYYAQDFLYFYYYLGYYPLVSTEKKKVYSKEGAEKLLNEHPEKLRMEEGHWYRSGENARILAYLPQAWLLRSTQTPGVRPFTVSLFCLMLCFIFYAFWKENLVLMGAMLVVLIGSNLHFLFEVYATDNILCLLIINAGLLLALNLKFILGKSYRYAWLIPVTSGIIIGFFSTLRAEVAAMMAGCMLLYILIPNTKWLHKMIYVVLIFVCFTAVKNSIRAYFDNKFEQAKNVCIEKGGHPYLWNRMTTHSFWHPMFVFLSDFDRKKGYGPVTKDTVAYTYATPILNKKYGYNLSYVTGYGLNDYYDKDSIYYKKHEEIPQYDEVLKEKVVADIKSDPMWYLEIIAKRIHKVLRKTSPISVTVAGYAITIPGINGYTLLPVIFLLLLTRNYTWLRLLLFVAPLSATSILMFAKGNSTYDAIFHIVALCLLLSAIYEAYQMRKKIC